MLVDGQISEDDKESWLSVEEFKNRHEDILSMSYEEANELSLEEIPFMDDVRDPVWEEETAGMKNTSKSMASQFMMTRKNEIIFKRRLYKKSILWLFTTSWQNVVSRR